MQLPFLNDIIRNSPPEALSERLLLTPFDELISVDLTTGRYHSRFHHEGKFFLPVINDTIQNLNQYLSDHTVHPDDRNLHRAFMDPNTLPARLANANPAGMLTCEFRCLSMDGNWLTTGHLLLSGARYGLPEGQMNIYVYDMVEMGRRLNGMPTGQDATEHLLGLMPNILTEEQFFAMAQERLPHLEGTWAMVAVDIKHFKLFKELNGQANGDSLLVRFAEILLACSSALNGLSGYRGQDDFALLVPFDKTVIDKLFNDLCRAIDSLSSSRGFFPVLGICLIDETGHNALELFNRAALTAEEIKDDLQSHIRIYEPEAHQRHVEEFRILTDFNAALQSGEISFFLQPQVDVSSGAVVGAESLARWRRADGRYIPPQVFVPVLEKYGIVTNLDSYLWESVCRWLRCLIDKGIRPVPVSVNVSRIDLFAVNVPEVLQSLMKKYALPRGILEVEITESAYVNDAEQVRLSVAELQKHGFKVLMDDFGSGYSSLNMLRTVNVDIIKLDAQFLHLSIGDELKGISILESVINMTKTLSTPLIVEGVESRELIDYLADMNIRYMQGFYFHRPMPADRFEALIAEPGRADYGGITFHGNDPLRVREFLDGSIYSDAMLNNILGAVAFYSFRDGNVDIIRYNQQFVHVVGLPLNILETRRMQILQYIHPEDREPFIDMLRNAREDRINGAVGHFRVYKPNVSIVCMQVRVYFLRQDENGASLYYASCQDITELQYINQDLPGAYYRATLEGGYEFLYVSRGFEELTGYTAQEIQDSFGNRLINMIHPEDRNRVVEESDRIRAGSSVTLSPYRLCRNDGSWRSVLDQSRITDRFGEICWQSILLDITDLLSLQRSMELLKKYSTDCIVFVNRQGPRLECQLAVYGLAEYLGVDEAAFSRALQKGDLGSQWIRTDRRLSDQIIENYEDPSILNGIYTLDLPGGRSARVHMRFHRVPEENGTAECIVSIFAVADNGIV